MSVTKLSILYHKYPFYTINVQMLQMFQNAPKCSKMCVTLFYNIINTKILIVINHSVALYVYKSVKSA